MPRIAPLWKIFAPLVAVVGLATPVLSAEIPTPGAPGIGDTLHPELGNGGYEVRHLWLNFRFSNDLTTYVATSTLQARATQSLSRFDLDLKGNQVQEVTIDGSPVKWSRTGEELQVTPPGALRRGTNFSVRVRVAGTIPGIEQTRHLGIPSVGLLHYDQWIQAISQPARAHCFAALDDHPTQKAPTTIIIAAPSRLNSISNGELTGTWRDAHDSTYTVRRFESRQKLATDLIQIGVGPFTVVRRPGPFGIKLRYALPTNQVKAIEPQLATVFEAIQFLEKRLGAFPLTTYGIYATPFGGGLETQSLTLLNASSLTTSEFQNDGTDATVLHELSHEYFGNSVSPRRWSDVWLNEGHATYYEDLWSEAHGGRTLESRMKRSYSRMNTLLALYGPIAAPRLSAFSQQEIAPYGPVPYSGGALALYALRQKVGQSTFERIERAWVHDYRDNVAGTADFIALAGRVSGRDLGPFLRSWLYGDHLPPMPNHPDWQPVAGLGKTAP